MANEKNVKELQHKKANPIASNNIINGGRKQNHQTSVTVTQINCISFEKFDSIFVKG
jgi:hypothetical protein